MVLATTNGFPVIWKYLEIYILFIYIIFMVLATTNGLPVLWKHLEIFFIYTCLINISELVNTLFYFITHTYSYINKKTVEIYILFGGSHLLLLYYVM